MKKLLLFGLLSMGIIVMPLLKASNIHECHSCANHLTKMASDSVATDSASNSCVLSGSGNVNRKYTPPPFSRLKSTGSTFVKKSTFDVYKYGFPSEEANEAFDYAVSIWEASLSSHVPIRVFAYWSKYLPSTVLAGCSPSGHEMNFYGETIENTLYPFSLQKKLIYTDFEGSLDMTIVINSEFENWYFGTDGNTPETKYDFITVILHELAHGLGFQGTATVNGFMASNAKVYTVYDRFLEDKDSKRLDTYENNTPEIKTALKSDMYFNGPLAKSANEGNKVKLHTPASFTAGSSIYHLDTLYNDDENALLTHQLDLGRAIHNPGPILMGMLKDMGWDVADISHKVKDLDSESTTYDLTFKASSEYTADTSDMKVYYRKDTDYGVPYSTASVSTLENNKYTAKLENLEYGNEYRYYIEIKDVKNGQERTFKYPAAGVVSPAHFVFGPDTVSPVIETVNEKISVWLPYQESFDVRAKVSDNAQMGDVKVKWYINGTEQTAVSMLAEEESSDIYNASVTLPANLSETDTVSYLVVANDKASTPNSVASHTEDEYPKVKLVFFEELFDNYKTSFTDADSNSHFLLDGFKILKPSNEFSSFSLNTPHPYDTYSDYIATFCKEISITRTTEITYDEIVLIEAGSDGIEYPSYYFYDYVVVEASKDNGTTWEALIPGYDSRENELWLNNWNSWLEDGEGMPPNSYYYASANEYKNRTIHLMSDAGLAEGDKILIRFRLHSDNIIYGWGWSIDNFFVNYDGEEAPNSLDNIEGNSLTIAPNPAADNFRILEPGNNVVEMYNIAGSKIKSVEVTGNSAIDVSTLESGIYAIRITDTYTQIAEIKKLIIK